MSNDQAVAVDAAEVDSTLHTLHLYEITVEPSQPGESSLVESSDVKESDRFDLNPLASLGMFNNGANFPLTLIQSADEQSDSGMNTEVVLMTECPPGEGQDELVNGITAAILTPGHELLMNDSPLDHTDVASLCVEDMICTTEELSDYHEAHQVIAYFETVPNVFPSDASGHITFTPDTVLSSALSSKPITSTLPIVSKHVTPSPTSLVLTVERLNAEGDDGKPEEEGTERQDQQLEEHWWAFDSQFQG